MKAFKVLTLESIELLSSSLFLKILFLLFALNFIVLRFPYSKYLMTHKQSVETRRLEVFDLIIGNYFADFVFFFTLLLALYILSFRGRWLSFLWAC